MSAGRTGKQIEHSLVPRIVGFLEEGTYKVVRVGNITQHIELLEGPGAGNKIVFQSLENPNQARERLQSFVAHFCWTDEMPNDVSIIGEILTRLIARNGYFMASFTPLVHNQSIKNMVEGATSPQANATVSGCSITLCTPHPSGKPRLSKDLPTFPSRNGMLVYSATGWPQVPRYMTPKKLGFLCRFLTTTPQGGGM